MKMMALAQKVQGDVAQGEDVPDDEEEVKEIAPALGAIARGASKALGFGAGAVAGSVGSSADDAGDAAGERVDHDGDVEIERFLGVMGDARGFVLFHEIDDQRQDNPDTEQQRKVGKDDPELIVVP